MPTFIGPTPPPSLHVMTLNVRRRLPWFLSTRADRWTRRRTALQQLLTSERPALLGLQEVMPAQSGEIGRMLGSGYASVGGGRNRNGHGERCELHIDTSRLRFLDSRVWWLSDTPTVAGSRSFGNRQPRVVVQAEIEDLQTGIRMHVFVTHFDYRSEQSRQQSARLLRDVVASTTGPAIVLGDFNADAGSETDRLLLEGGVLEDALTAARRHPNPDWGSFSQYRSPRIGAPRLDWVLVTPSTDVEVAGVNPARFGGIAASDHEPVQALLRLDASGDSAPRGDVAAAGA